MDAVVPVIRDRFVGKHITAEEFVEYVVDVSSAALDAAIDTGPLDPVDDGMTRMGIEGIYDVLTDVLTPDPHKMRQRASRLRNEGRLNRALRLENRAGRIEARG
jgi:hypothetical protein